MKIIICGAYAIGTHLARLLSRNQEEITVIDSDQERLAKIGFDYDLLTLQGSPTSVKTLKEANTAAADLFIADADAFASLPGFFIPKRNRLALLSNSTDDNIGFTLNRHCDEAAFLKQLGDIIETSRHNRSDGNELSQREIDVLCLLAKGFTNKEIADRLFISINTVLTHRKNISAKLGIRSVSGLSVYAIMNGYITDIPDI